MFSTLSRLFVTAPETAQAQHLYIAIVAQSRNPFFYERLEVPDTLDGRFEMIVLHLFLLMHRLKREDAQSADELRRTLSEALFDDMDRSLREMGVGDTSVGRRIQHMAEAFYGRLRSYEDAFDSPENLHQALLRNVYASKDTASSAASQLAAYMVSSASQLQTLPADKLTQAFPLPLQESASQP